MRKDLAKWLLNSSMNPRMTLVLAVSWLVILIGLHAVLPIRSMESRIISPLLFQVRELLGHTPALSPKVKVFAVDDVSVNYLHGTELSLKQWGDVLGAIDKKNPRAIIVDALFGTVRGSEGDGEAERDALNAVETPIYTGAFPSSVSIFGRKALDLDTLAFKESSYTGDEEENTDAVVANFRSSQVYGASEELQPIFNRTGHILYGDNEGSFFPFLGLKDQKVLPHLMLQPFSDTTLQGSRVSVDGAIFKVARDGSVPINFGRRSDYDSRVKPLVHLMNPAWQKLALDQIEEGDYVVILPLFYTGNTDFKPSPIGLIPGGYAQLAILSSIIERQTISYFEGDVWVMVAFTLVLTAAAWWLSPLPLLVSLLALSAAWIVVCFGSFIYLGTVVPYLLPQFTIIAVGVSLLMQRIKIADRKSRMIRHTLEGFVRPDALVSLQRNPESLAYSLDARERELTVMFIDIVGFSLMVENQMPRAAFQSLQVVFKGISEIIHRHGGVVNKTLGDGLLCYFGYSLESHEPVQSHVEQATNAAFQIQRLNVSRMLNEDQTKNPVFPLRIGINTGPVFMGNIGSGQRVDITVVGTGVNFAKRLESACQAHQVLVGRTTHYRLEKTTGFGLATKRWLSIKHHEEAAEGWEYDPFYDDPSVRERAKAVHPEIEMPSRRSS